MRSQTSIILGILNLTPDSFSDGGEFVKLAAAVKQAEKMRAAGADLIDVGGESTRPGARAVSVNAELKRVLPVLKKLKTKNFRLSLDSRKPEVVAECLPFIDWINDVEGFGNPEMQQLAAKSKKTLIVMHSQEVPVNPKKVHRYPGGVIFCLQQFFEKRICELERAGVAKNKIVLDPGIGFGKSLADNLKILANLNEFVKLGSVCLGASRKSFIGKIDSNAEILRLRSQAHSAQDDNFRLGGSLAAVLTGFAQGVQIFRVHDVAETAQALRVAAKIKSSK